MYGSDVNKHSATSPFPKDRKQTFDGLLLSVSAYAITNGSKKEPFSPNDGRKYILSSERLPLPWFGKELPAVSIIDCQLGEIFYEIRS